MDGLSKTDEVLALLNKRERGEGPKPASAAASDEHLGFTDFLPSPAAAVLHKLQRISAQPRSDQPKSVTHTINRTPSDALKVVLGEQRPEPRKLRYSCLPVLVRWMYCLTVDVRKATQGAVTGGVAISQSDATACILQAMILYCMLFCIDPSFGTCLQALNCQLQKEVVWP